MLNKETVAHLSRETMDEAKGGATGDGVITTLIGYTCKLLGTCQTIIAYCYTQLYLCDDSKEVCV